MEKRVTISLRLPEDLLAEIRRVAAEEERPLNTQVLRFIRTGLHQHQARGTLEVAFAAYCQGKVWKRADLAEHLGITPEALTEMSSHALPDVKYSDTPIGIRATRDWGAIRTLAERSGADPDRLIAVVKVIEDLWPQP